MIRVLIADDHPIVRKGLKGLLLEESKSNQIGEAQNVQEVLDLSRSQHWDVVLLDISMPGGGGMEALKHLRQEQPKLPVLILSIHSEDEYAVRVLKAGAAGYLTKESLPDELHKAIRKVLGGGKYISDALAEQLADTLDRNVGEPAHAELSDREFQVMCMIASGKATGQIAKELSLSVKTIGTFRNRLFKKMKMKNDAELTRYALEHKLLE